MTPKPAILMISGDNTPIPLMYFSQKYSNYFDFYESEPRDRRKIWDHIGDQHDIIIKQITHLSTGLQKFRVGSDKGRIKKLFNYVKYLTIVDFAKNSFDDFCLS